ncbi:MAG: hypothetical protein AAF253_07505 [Pseudomonadota bacterium]
MPVAWPVSAKSSSGPVQGLRLVLILAISMSVGLLAWRTSTVLAVNPPAEPAGPAMPAEYLLEPFTGPGHVRVIRSGTPASVLVLLDTNRAETAALTSERIAELLAAAGLYQPLAGETITVQRTAFAQIGPAPLTLTDGAELAGFALLSGLLALALFQTRRPPVDTRQERARRSVSVRAAADAVALPGRGLGPRPEQAPGHKDPEAVAAMLRQWIREDVA